MKGNTMPYLIALIFTVVAGTAVYEAESGQKWNCDTNPKMVCVYELNN